MGHRKVIYLDYAASTPVDEEVLQAMLPYFREKYGNSMAKTSLYGWEADDAVEGSRRRIARLLRCESHEITFTSGATESNNWAIEGVLGKFHGENIHILSSPVEHSSVLQKLYQVQRDRLAQVEFLKVNEWGQIDLEDLKNRLRPETRLVCAVWANNEVGTINPVPEIGRICREHGAWFLSDATQAIGKVPVDLSEVPVDLISFSAHKLYGPKGVGLLFHRRRGQLVDLPPLIYGGGHERGLRSGTVNVPGIVGMAKALELTERYSDEPRRLKELRDTLWEELNRRFERISLNGAPLQEQGPWPLRSPSNLHVTFAKAPDPLHLPGLAISQGAACQSGKTDPSAILAALGRTPEEARASLRLTVGRFTNPEDVLQAAEIIDRYLNDRKGSMAFSAKS